MPTVLVHNAYGKSRVRLTKVQRHPDRHDLFEWSIDVRLTGDFAAAYTAGDNRQVIATDTMKNIVYALAADHHADQPGGVRPRPRPAFPRFVPAGRDRRRFRFTSSRGSGSRSTADRILTPSSAAGSETPHLLPSNRPRNGQRIVSRHRRPDAAQDDRFGVPRFPPRPVPHVAGRRRPHLRDQPDGRMAVRRATPTGTSPTRPSGGRCWRRSPAHKSLGVQHTLHAMGEAALACCPAVEEITLTMPNRHRLLVNLQPFGRENAERGLRGDRRAARGDLGNREATR